MSTASTTSHTDLRVLGDLVDRLREDGTRTAMLSMDEAGPKGTQRSQLADQAARLAGGLLDRGVGPGSRVAVCSSTSLDWVAAALAILRSGATVVPLDPLMEEESFAHVLRDCRPAVVFTDARHERLINDLEPEPFPEVFLLGQGDGSSLRRHASSFPPASWPEMLPEDEAVLFYTSGTTGPPKGVPLTHANVSFQVATIAQAGLISPGDRMLLALPLHHVYPFVFGLLTPLALKVGIVTPQALTGPQLLRAVREGGVTTIVGVPRLYQAIYEGLHSRVRSRSRFAAWLLQRAEGLCVRLRRSFDILPGRWLLRPVHRQLGGRLRLLASGGAPLEGDLVRRLEGIGWLVTVGYGLTETSPLLTMRQPGKGPEESVGRVIPEVELRIDPEALAKSGERGTDQGSSSPGEILARGPGVFQGYLNLPEETGKALSEDGWFRTGDLGSFDAEGYLYVTGRLSTLIVTQSGENVQPDRIESVLAQHPWIAEIGVLSREGKLVAVAVPDSERIEEAGQQDERRAVEQAVAEYANRLPSFMHLAEVRVSRESLARTRLGKIRRHLLEQRFEEAASGGTRHGPDPIAVADMSDEDQSLLENRVARQVWERLCERFPNTGLTPDTHPEVELGVDSMEWLNLTLEIHELTGAEISEGAIERIRSVRDLLRAAVDASKDSQSVSDPVENPYRVLSPEQRTWLMPRSLALKAMAWAVYWLGSAAFRLLYRVRAEGRDRLSCSGACVLAPNHASYLDPIALAHVLGPADISSTYWAGLTTAAFNNPFKRFMCRLGQAVPITPDHGAVSALAFAAAILRKNARLVWFPEGRRSPDGNLQSFKLGLGTVLKRIPVPVIPIWIEGTHTAWPVGRRLPRPGSIRIVLGDPVSVDELQQAGTSDRLEWRIMQGLQQRIADLRPDGDGFAEHLQR